MMKISKLLVTGLFGVSACFGAQIDLSAQGATGVVGGAGGAFIEQFTLSSSAGSGVINSFLRIQTNNSTESGYNTTGAFEFNTSTAAALQLQNIPLVAINNGNYYEFFLDTNQSNGGNGVFLSLDTLQIFTASTSNQTGYSTTAIGSALKIFDIGPDTAKLDDEWGSGSGKGDYLVYIPQAAFANALPTDFVYLYSAFGATFANTSGFEEWYTSGSSTVSIGGGPVVGATPEPASWLLGATGIVLLAARRRRRTA
jgi:MYXO-CTERM domain-containing protein